MILTLIGADDFAKDERINGFLEKALGERKNDPLARKIIFATDTNIPSIAEEIIETCSSVSMFAPEQTVILRKADALKAADTAALVSWLSTKPECSLLFEFEKLAARAPKKTEGESTSGLYSALKAAGTIEKYDLPKPWEMEKWISTYALTHLGKRMDPAAVRYVSEALGSDSALIAAELQKIMLFAPETKVITYEQAKTMIVPQRDIQAHEIRDSFGNRDAKAFTKKLRELLDNNTEGVSLVSSLFHFSVRLMHICSMLEQGLSPKEIAGKFGTNEWLFCTKTNEPRMAKNWGKPLLCRVIKRLGELDYEIKTGKCESRMSLELSLAALVVR